MGAKFRVPDFGPEATIARRGSIVEVKNVTRLTRTPQLEDLVEQVRLESIGRGRRIVLEIRTNAPPPMRGWVAERIDEGIIRIKSIP
jgi:hypothetical protein